MRAEGADRRRLVAQDRLPRRRRASEAPAGSNLYSFFYSFYSFASSVSFITHEAQDRLPRRRRAIFDHLL